MMSTTEVELDVDVPNEREDGELEDSDVEEGAYIPLQRPESFNPPSLVNMQIQDEQSDEASLEESSGTDSDDELRRPKRTKIRPKRPQPAQNDKKNKYNIWCKTLQEELLTEDMVGCDVTKKRDFGVETYDYTIKYRLDDNFISKKVFSNSEESRFSNKRRHEDRKNVKLRLGKRVNSYQEDVKFPPRILADLAVTAESNPEDIAKDIAVKLHEEKHDLILRIVNGLGANKAIELFKETQKVEADGGVLVVAGNRRRTSGGVYIYLLKRDGDLSPAVVNKIFDEDKKANARKIKQARSSTRQKVVEQLKQTLNDSELPSLLSRGETTVSSTEHGSNPPPSPVTDAKDCSSDTDAPQNSPPRNQDPRTLNSYDDDDYLEVMVNDDMDMF